jgi:hypothetical protein
MIDVGLDTRCAIFLPKAPGEPRGSPRPIAKSRTARYRRCVKICIAPARSTLVYFNLGGISE